MSCRYPEHHDDHAPGVLQLIALLVVVGTVAIIVTHWKAVLACVVIAGVVLVLAAALMAMARHHGSGYDRELERQAAVERAQRQQTALPIAPPAPAVTAPAAAPALESAPVVHQHLHVHGLSSDEMAAVVRKALTRAEDD